MKPGSRWRKILDVFVPRGLFPPVVPGTRYVTVGGMVAANVHGKNHHKAGGFGSHVERLTLIAADGSPWVCSPTQNAELFRATIGGMGLTEIIRDVTFRLLRIDSAFVRNETVIAPDLDAVFRAFEASRDWTYTVAWIDSLARGGALGRSVLFRGEHAQRGDLDARQAAADRRDMRPKLSVPFYPPGFILNRLSVRAFNSLYFSGHRPGTAVVPLLRYFFPLDAIGHWNRLYGRGGFVQYQCVIPKSRSREALGEILEMVAARGSPSFLTVLKLLGPDDAGLLAFPLEGYTLTLDFHATAATLRLVAELDRRVMDFGGRVYLAKDACQSPALVEAGYPHLNAFRTLRQELRRCRQIPVAAVAKARAMNETTKPNAKTMLLLGATSDIGRAIADTYAAAGWRIILAGRNRSGCERNARDLEIRHGAAVPVLDLDISASGRFPSFLDALPQLPDTVVSVVGLLGDQRRAESELDHAAEVLRTNFEGPALLLGLFANRMAVRGSGTLVGVSSVAGERGRASNYVYGSAKAGFTAFLSGLRNRLAGRGVHVLTVNPGYVRTRMTDGLALPNALTADPATVGAAVYRAAEQNKRDVIYVLPVWRLVMLIIRAIPERIFKRLRL